MIKIKNKLSSKYTIPLLVFIYYLAYFSVILKSGYISDDALNINVGGVVYNNISIFDFTFSIINSWMGTGRFFPFAFYMYGLFSIISSRFIYKLLIVLSIYLNSILFGQYVKKITESDKLKYYFIILFPILIQLTCEFNSSLYSFHMLMQLTLLWLFLSLHALISYIDKGKILMYILSVFFFFMALGTYEIAFTFILIIALTVYAVTHKLKRTIKIISPHLGVLAIMLFINIYLRFTAQLGSYAGVTINLDIKLMITTFLKQCFSTFPLARYFATFGKNIYAYSWKTFIPGIQMMDIFLVVLFFVIIILIEKLIKKQIIIMNKVILLFIALLLFIMPGMLISISERYQQELQWGTGHLPSYMQSFGFTLFCAILYIMGSKLRLKRIKRILSICGAAIITLLIMMNQQVGRASVESINTYYRWPRENVENAIKKGVLSELSSDDLLIGTTYYTFDVSDGRYFYSLEEKKLVNVKSQSELVNDLVQEQHESNIYNMLENGKKYAIYSYADKNFGYVIIGECAEVELNYDRTDADRISVINPKVYIQGDFSDINEIGFRATDNLDTYQFSMKSYKLNEMKILHKDEESRIYQINYNGKIDIKSMLFDEKELLSAEQEPTESLIYCKLGKGFTGVEGETPKQWMWLSNDSELIIYNYLEKDLKYRLNFDIFSGYNETSKLEMYINDELYEYNLTSDGTTINKDITLNIGENIIKFKSNAQQIYAPNDPRELYLKITNFNMFDQIK